MSMMRRIRHHVAKWRDDESGSIAVETLLMVPLMSWALLATLTYFDAYRAEAISQKAGLTIADMISREADYITPAYITGARGLLKFLSINDNNPDLRVTVARFDGEANAYKRVWSKERGPRSALSDGEVSGMSGVLPVMSDGERVIIVETWTEYKAPYTIGLDDFDMRTFTVISPRFVDRICWNATPSEGEDTAVC